MKEPWPTHRLGTCYEVRDDRAGSMAHDFPLLSVSQTQGIVPRAQLVGDSGRAEDLSNYKIALSGDIVLNRMSAYNGALGVARQNGIVSPDYLVMVPTSRANGDFIAAWLKTPFGVFEMSRRLRGIGSADAKQVRTPRVNESDLRLIPIPLPPADEQRVIADYLDRETARIDTLITEQQRLIEILRERRQAASTSKVGTRVGIGERLKWSLEEFDIRAGELSAVLPLMSVSIDWGVRRRDEVTADEARATDFSNYKICRRGDLVINRMRAFQGALGLAPEDGIVSPDYAVLRAASEINGTWLAAAMKTDRFVSEMARRIKGIGSADLGAARTPRINVRDLCDIRLAVPTKEVQAEEIGRLRRAVDDIDTLIAETERFIELSRERRSALITAAVTGQIDVREGVA